MEREGHSWAGPAAPRCLRCQEWPFPPLTLCWGPAVGDGGSHVGAGSSWAWHLLGFNTLTVGSASRLCHVHHDLQASLRWSAAFEKGRQLWSRDPPAPPSLEESKQSTQFLGAGQPRGWHPGQSQSHPHTHGRSTPGKTGCNSLAEQAGLGLSGGAGGVQGGWSAGPAPRGGMSVPRRRGGATCPAALMEDTPWHGASGYAVTFINVTCGK